MGLFDKKFCDICGEKIGLLGNRKLEDGNCCKDCAKKLSPWFDERRHSTVAQIKEQLAYREDNKSAVAAFRTSRSFGDGYTMLYVDENARKFVVGGTDFREENADVVDLSQVVDARLDVHESHRELKQKNAQGQEVSFNPPRYEYHYDFDIEISVNHPWFDKMRFQLNRNSLVLQETAAVRAVTFGGRQSAFDPHVSYEYQKYENLGQQVVDVLLGRAPQQAVAADITQQIAAAAAAAAAQLAAQSQNAQAQAQAAFAAQGLTAPAEDALRVDASNPNYVQAQEAADSWTCSCGTTNTGRFCVNCGASKPAAVPGKCAQCGWEPETPGSLPRFCPNCGAPLQ